MNHDGPNSLHVWDVQALVDHAEYFRGQGDFKTADAIRDRLGSIGVRVRNGSQTWTVHGSNHQVRDWKGWVF